MDEGVERVRVGCVGVWDGCGVDEECGMGEDVGLMKMWNG